MFESERDLQSVDRSNAADTSQVLGPPSGTELSSDEIIPIYVSMRPDLERFLTARLDDAAAAEDVYQAMFLRLKTAKLSALVSKPRAFLYEMAANLAADHRRGKQRGQIRDRQWLDLTTHRLGPDVVVDTAGAEDVIDAKRRLRDVAEAINDLPPKCRQTFVMHKLEGLSHLEISERLGVSRKAIEKHMTTAFKHLVSRLRTRATEI